MKGALLFLKRLFLRLSASSHSCINQDDLKAVLQNTVS